MATKYVTLKDSDGNTLYPQAVATNLAPGSIDYNEIDWSSIKVGEVSIDKSTSALSNIYSWSEGGKIYVYGKLAIIRLSMSCSSNNTIPAYGNKVAFALPSGLSSPFAVSSTIYSKNTNNVNQYGLSMSLNNGNVQINNGSSSDISSANFSGYIVAILS